MPVLAPQNKKVAEVEREPQTNITDLEGPNIQVYMTYSGDSHESVMSPELAAWVNARCSDTGCSALDLLIGCAELCAELD
jgi:hypothetical protein